MTTTFALTGFQRFHARNYRPSYFSGLAPIYEDVPIQRVADKGRISDTEIDLTNLDCYNNEIKVYCSKTESFHNYAYVDERKVGKTAERPVVKSSSSHMLDSMMNSRFQKKRDRSSRQSKNSENSNVSNDCKSPHSQMENGIVLCPSNHLHKDLNMNCFKTGVGGNDLAEAVNVPTATDGYETENTTIHAERKSSLYQCSHNGSPSMPGVKDYGVVRSDGGVAVKRWPKLEPEPPSNSQFCCPAERKLKKRCFAVCFAALVCLIIGFLVSVVNGWLIDGTGRTITGRDAQEAINSQSDNTGISNMFPMVFMSPTDYGGSENSDANVTWTNTTIAP